MVAPSRRTPRKLEKVASMIGTPGKGITACDEGAGTIGDRFAVVGIENTEENRRSYRQILFESQVANNTFRLRFSTQRRFIRRAPTPPSFPQGAEDRESYQG